MKDVRDREDDRGDRERGDRDRERSDRDRDERRDRDREAGAEVEAPVRKSETPTYYEEKLL